MPSQVSPSLHASNSPGRIGRWLGKLLALGYRLTGKDRYDDYRVEHVVGLPIIVLPTVANPKALRTGAFFASALDESVVPPGCEVLDLGTGSGICALIAARHARRVVATDINPAAIRCARANALINAREATIELRQGDLFAAVTDERFDLVLFNPPFRLGDAADHRGAAWYGGNLAARFAAGLAARLKPGGFGLLLLSSYGDACPAFETELAARGFELSVFAQRRWINETVTILRAMPASDQPKPE